MTKPKRKSKRAKKPREWWVRYHQYESLYSRGAPTLLIYETLKSALDCGFKRKDIFKVREVKR